MDYIAQAKDYWIAPGAITITLNALGSPQRIQGTVSSGAVIMCYIKGVDGLEYDNGHQYRAWSISISPTYFNSFTKKYVYMAIPRNTEVGAQAIIVFPSEKLDIYGVNEYDEQIGSEDYYYIWLQALISDSAAGGIGARSFLTELNFGLLSTDEARDDQSYNTDWYSFSTVTQTVTFLKDIIMKAGSSFRNLILGGKELTGVATGATPEDIDSDTLVVTPNYIRNKFLHKDRDDTTPYNLGVGGNLNVDHNVTADQLIANLLKTPGFISNLIAGGLAGLGFGVTTDANGRATTQTDDLIVLGRMFVNSLNIREVSYIGGVYLLTPAGSTVDRVIPLYTEDSEHYGDTRYWTTEDVGGLIVGYRLLWKADDGTTSTMNYWHQGDQAFCEIFNINEAGHYDNFHNRRYWRLVCRTGHVTIDDKEYNYADLSDYAIVSLYKLIDEEYVPIRNASGGLMFLGYEGYSGGSNPNSIPEVGDKVVCLGSQADTTRQAAIQLSAEGTGSIGIYDGINDYLPLSLYEIHFMSKDAVRMRASRFFLTTQNNVQRPATVYCGEWTQGNLSEWGYEWTYGGQNWLCILPRTTVTPDGTGITREAPGTTPEWWQSNKGESGKTYALGFYTDGDDPTPIVGLAVRPASIDETVVPYLLYGQDDITNNVSAWLWERESNYPDLDLAWKNSARVDPDDPTSPLKSVTRTLHITTDDLPAGWDANNGKVGFKCTATFNYGGEDTEIINRISIV